jgi:predicted nucleic acid-binding protein
MAGVHLNDLHARVLVDTSVWVEFIRTGNAQLFELLQKDQVLMHDMVIGEIACGSAPSRIERLQAMDNLPKIALAEHSEVMRFIESHRLFGCGVGYVDNHLLAACVLQADCALWSHDKRLRAAAERLGIAFNAVKH